LSKYYADKNSGDDILKKKLLESASVVKYPQANLNAAVIPAPQVIQADNKR